MTPREPTVFVGASVSARRNKENSAGSRHRAREDIKMLEKAPNGKITSLLNALDEALSAGDVDRAADLFQTDCYWRAS